MRGYVHVQGYIHGINRMEQIGMDRRTYLAHNNKIKWTLISSSKIPNRDKVQNFGPMYLYIEIDENMSVVSKSCLSISYYIST